MQEQPAQPPPAGYPPQQQVWGNPPQQQAAGWQQQSGQPGQQPPGYYPPPPQQSWGEPGGYSQPPPPGYPPPVQQPAPMEPGAWQPPLQQGVGDWPAPSAMPERQESWGMAPAQASWVAMESASAFPQEHDDGHPVANKTVSAHERSQDKWTGAERCNIIFAWIFTIGCWYFLFIMIPICETLRTNQHICSWYWAYDGTRVERSAGPFGALGVLYLILFIGAMSSPVRQYLGHILPGGVEPYLSSMTTATPVIKWNIVCSHTESRGGGKNRRTVTVVTHRAEYDYPYDSWWDVSEPMASTGNAIATRVRLGKEWKAADPHTQSVHDKLHQAWVVANDRDVHKTVSIQVVVPNWQDSVMSFKNPNDPPCGLNSATYVIFSFLTLGVFYQHYFYTRTTASDFMLTKLIQRIPRPDDPQ